MWKTAMSSVPRPWLRRRSYGRGHARGIVVKRESPSYERCSPADLSAPAMEAAISPWTAKLNNREVRTLNVSLSREMGAEPIWHAGSTVQELVTALTERVCDLTREASEARTRFAWMNDCRGLDNRYLAGRTCIMTPTPPSRVGTGRTEPLGRPAVGGLRRRSDARQEMILTGVEPNSVEL